MRPDVNRLKNLANNVQYSGQELNYCPCGKPVNRCSLGIKRENNVVMYNCFSSGCPIGSGRLLINVDEEAFHEHIPPKKSGVQFVQLTHKIPKPELEYLAQFNIGKRTIHKYGIEYDTKYRRIVFPIRNLDGDTIANTARALHNNIKWLHDGGLNGICYYSNTSASLQLAGEKVGVIVEDPLSAIVTGQVTPCLALLGTKYKSKLEAIKEWKRFNKIDLVMVCLDLDAWKYGVEFASWLNRHGVKAIPKRIDRDMKWCSDKEIVEIIKGD